MKRTLSLVSAITCSLFPLLFSIGCGGGKTTPVIPGFVPVEPTSVDAKAVSSSSIRIQWEYEEPKEVLFEIHRSNDGFEYVILGETDDLFFVDSGLPLIEMIYTYKIRAIVNGKPSDDSMTAEATILIPPSDLESIPISDSRIKLEWSDHSAKESGFDVMRSLDGINYKHHATVEADGTSFTDEELAPETMYSYKIKAFDYSGGVSDFSEPAQAETLMIPWAKSYGLSGKENVSSTTLAWDGSMYLAGSTDSNGTDAGIVLKLTPTGEIDWAYSYDGSGVDRFRSVSRTGGDGCILAGYTSSYGEGSYDILVMKLDETGDIEWQKTYGTSIAEAAYSIIRTKDGGYLLTGYLQISGRSYEILVMKLDPSGDVTWKNTYGGTGRDAVGIQGTVLQTVDGGYIVAGYTDSFGAGDKDIIILNLSDKGIVRSQKAIGGPEYECPLSVIQTQDSGFVLVADTRSFGAGDREAWVLKLDTDLSLEWQKTFGGSLKDKFDSIIQTKDGGYVAAGESFSFGTGDYDDAWIVRMAPDGSVEWQKTYGGSFADDADLILETGDGAYYIGGDTTSFGAGQSDIWFLRLNKDGTIDFNNISGAKTEDTDVVGADTSVESEDTYVDVIYDPSLKKNKAKLNKTQLNLHVESQAP